MPPVCRLGRVEKSKTFQNQMSQWFVIGLYDIETGDDFYFLQKFFLIGGNGFQTNQFVQGKNGQNKPENHQKCPSLRPKKWHFECPNQNSGNISTYQKKIFGKNKNHPQFLYHINQ